MWVRAPPAQQIVQIKLASTFNLDKVWYFNSKNISLSEKIQVTPNPDQTV